MRVWKTDAHDATSTVTQHEMQACGVLASAAGQVTGMVAHSRLRESLLAARF